MSNLDPRPEAVSPRAGVVRAVDVLEARDAAIGAWCLIVTVRDAWTNGTFGEVRGCAGEPLAAPPLPPGELKPR